MSKKIRLTAGVALVALSAATAAAQTYEQLWSTQLPLIGVTDSLQNSAGNGRGVLAGVIDSGIAADHVEFGGRVSAASTCVIAGCSAALARDDDYGHGTHVAGIIAAARDNYGMMGVAPGASLLAVKALGAGGSGYVADVAAGIRYAVDHGAQVLNLSMTFVPTPELVAAINYAAAKRAYVVFAGGNTAAAILSGGSAGGFSRDALQRLLFVGSTDAQKRLSYFTSTPGAGGLTTTGGQTMAFRDMWLLADGENIWSASNYKDPQYLAALAAGQPAQRSYYVQMSGTSMAAPQVTGALALLAARWPFLLKSGTAAQILLQSAQDLGAAGHDDLYGAGFLRVDQAFQPVGTLRVAGAGGTTLAASLGGSRLVGSAALGDLRGVSAQLGSTVALDAYGRDFPVSLAGLVTARQRRAPLAGVSPGSGLVSSSSVRLASDAALTLSLVRDEGALSPTHPLAFTAGGAEAAPAAWSMALSAGDRTVGAGRGTGIALDLSEARWGAGSAFAGTGADMSTALLALSGQSGYVFAGLPLGEHGRLAVALTQASDDGLVGLDGRTGGATGAAASYTMAPAAGWKVSLSAAMLDEEGLLLGANGAGALGLGNARSTSLGLGTSVDLGEGWQLGADGVVARSAATRNAASLVAGTSPLLALGFGAALKKARLLDDADEATLAVTKPLRVYAGHADLDIPVGLDGDGNVLVERRRAALAPEGSETALSLGYARPVGRRARLGLTLSFREDADNVPGRAAVGAMLRFAASF